MEHTYYYEDGLESERLVTRMLSMEDVPAWSEFFRSDETTEFLRAHVLSTAEESAEKWIQRQLDRYKNEEYGHQALISKSTGELVGLSGIIKQEVDGQVEMEVGYHVLRKHWGQGYAPEAARIFFNYGFDNGIADRIVSIIDVNNVKSQRVADKNGLEMQRQTRYKDMDVYIYEVHKGNWKK